MSQSVNISHMNVCWTSTEKEERAKIPPSSPPPACLHACLRVCLKSSQGQKTERNLNLFPTAETERRAHVSDFLLGAILQFSSVNGEGGGGGGRRLRACPNLLLVVRQQSAHTREGEEKRGAQVTCSGLRVMTRTYRGEALLLLVSMSSEDTHKVTGSLQGHEDRLLSSSYYL